MHPLNLTVQFQHLPMEALQCCIVANADQNRLRQRLFEQLIATRFIRGIKR